MIRYLLVAIAFALVSTRAPSYDDDADAQAALALARAARERAKPAPAPAPAPPTVSPYRGIAWWSGSAYADAIFERERTGKPLLLLFTNPKTCPECRKLESGALSEDVVIQALQDFVCVRIDTNRPDSAALVAFYKRTAIPSILVYRGPVGQPSLFAGEMSGDVCGAGLVEFLKAPTTKTKTTISKPKTVPTKMGMTYNPSHVCPNPDCGREQFRVNHMYKDTHTHRCSNCQTEWFHNN